MDPAGDLARLEIEDADSYFGEEGQSLVARSKSGSSRTLGISRGGGGRARMPLDVLVTQSDIDIRRWRIYKWGATLLAGLIALVAVYRLGQIQGYALNVISDPYDVAHLSVADTPIDLGPTYRPTNRPTKLADTGPTYRPTNRPTNGQKTSRPTFVNGSWVPEPNPFLDKFNTTEWVDFVEKQWETRSKNAIAIHEKYGHYCPKEPNVPMCPHLDEEGKIQNKNKLLEQPTVICNDTGTKKNRCGGNGPWLNKTVWPLIRGPFCAIQDAERRKKFPLPTELEPYFELGYDRADPTKSKDAAPFDGGLSVDGGVLSFDPVRVNEHFLKLEAMLEHYYEGLARSLLEKQLAPMPDDVLYAPMLKAYADQVARALIRAKDKNDSTMVIGVLGDSVTSGTDNCYYDAWPEVLRRQLAPLFASMGLKLEVRNAAKNGGWNLASQLLCANDMLGGADRPNNAGIDFLFVTNPFVHAEGVDAEHVIRRALLGKSHTVVSIAGQGKLSKEKMLTRYAAAGLTVATPWQNAPPELGIPGGGGYRYWFPKQDKAFWGMQGNGFCHLTTRAGSSAVVNRNWHWGPMTHQTYADAYALLFSRATRQAIEELSSGRMPPEPPKPGDIDQIILPKDKPKEKPDHPPPTWKDLLTLDMGLNDIVSGGISGVRCAVGSANQPGSTLLPHWLHPAEGSPFEDTMKARNGVSFIPSDHDAEDSKFYKVQSPISGPNSAHGVGEWVADPKQFSPEAPRTAEQCMHVDGSTMVNMPNPEGVSWLVWKVPEGALSVGRVMMCHPRGSKVKALAEDSFEGDVRFHYALPDGKGGFKMIEDVHKQNPTTFVGQECWPVIVEMNDADLKAASDGGVWVAVEWKQEAIFDFDYLVAI